MVEYDNKEEVGKGMQELNNKLNGLGEWVIRLVYLNFLWIGFSLLGLGILGIFPATSALVSVLRKYFIKNERVKISSEFYRYYKKDFWKSNGLGYFFLIVAIVLWADYLYVKFYRKSRNVCLRICCSHSVGFLFIVIMCTVSDLFTLSIIILSIY